MFLHSFVVLQLSTFQWAPQSTVNFWAEECQSWWNMTFSKGTSYSKHIFYWLFNLSHTEHFSSQPPPPLNSRHGNNSLPKWFISWHPSIFPRIHLNCWLLVEISKSAGLFCKPLKGEGSLFFFCQWFWLIWCGYWRAGTLSSGAFEELVEEEH